MRYERPETAQAACALLADESNAARVLAGGTDLSVDLRAGNHRPGLLVDIKRIPGIREIRWNDDGSLSIGAAVSMRQVYEDATLCETFPALAEGAEAVGSLQVRARATVGGNLCNASPCMDTAPPLLVLDGALRVAGPAGERLVALRDFFIGVKRTQLQPGELAVAIEVPAASRALRTAFDKIKRVQGHDLALVNAAVSYHPERKVLRAAVGSCGVTPLPTPDLSNIEPSREVERVAERLAQLALEHISPISDVRASAEYRQDMTALLCKRLVRRLLGAEEVQR